MDLYAAVGAPENANQEQLKACYKKTALRLHPDKNAGDQSVRVLSRNPCTIAELHCRFCRHRTLLYASTMHGLL
jgi:curved DNA-binding protein CbpA